ncbi:MAG: DUF4412 domain-containing protein [Verrucomicrobiota bacterium]
MPDDLFKEFVPRQLSARVKKPIFIFAALIAPLVAARADLVMEQQSSSATATDHITLKVHGDKMRMDQRDKDGYVFSVIIDLNTRDSMTLFPQGKSFLKRSGAEIRQQMEAERKTPPGTNEMSDTPARAVDTGTTATVGGYDTEIYTWSGPNGLTETLWVATNFPDYESIRPELAKLDRFDASGPHKDAQPKLSLLPGMVVKAEKASGGRKVTTTLISAKVEPVDAALFELPADYSPWKPPEVRLTTPATMQTNDKSPRSP